VDGASDPYYVDLPYFEKALANRTTQTISMPLSALVDDPSAHSRARMEITVVGREDGVPVNNEFTVYLGGNDALRFVREPEDVSVQEGEDVSFEVEVGGGVKPYTYQWQIWDPVHEEWVDLPGFTEPTLSRKDVEKKWDGCRFRCVVTDAAGTQIVSQEVTLTIRDKVPTGDSSNLPLYLAVAAAALALLWWMRRRTKRA
jgi:MYXO-CTERM domain-containing protein